MPRTTCLCAVVRKIIFWIPPLIWSYGATVTELNLSVTPSWSWQLSQMGVWLEIRRSWVWPPAGQQHFLMQSDHKIFPVVIFSLPLIKEGCCQFLAKELAGVLVNCRPRWPSWMRVRLETRRSRVWPWLRSPTFFPGDWSLNIFYGHSLPSAESRRAVLSFWRKNVHNTG